MKPALVLGLAAALAASGCSETRFADMLGAGKQSPDETQVRTGQALTMPPDLRLPAPGAAAADGNVATTAAAQPVAPAPDRRTATAKHSEDFWASELQPKATASGAAPDSAQARKESFWSSNTNNLFTTPGKHNAFWDADPNVPKTKPVTRDEAFARYGISKTKPDGTPKTDNELDRELKAAVLADKRKANPDYGTIGNLRNVFSDG